LQRGRRLSSFQLTLVEVEKGESGTSVSEDQSVRALTSRTVT
jgi:hypothetical protein